MKYSLAVLLLPFIAGVAAAQDAGTRDLARMYSALEQQALAAQARMMARQCQAPQSCAETPAAEPAFHDLLGKEFSGAAPPGVSFESGVALLEQGKPVLFRMNLGKYRGGEILWIDRIEARDSRGGIVRAVVSDVREVPRVKGGAMLASCFELDSGKRGRLLYGTMGLVISEAVIEAWGIDPLLGRFQELDPKQVGCESEGD